MTSRDFRSIAISFPETEERSHFDHPDFRVSGKIFATLGFPKNGWGMVKLNPKLQKQFVADHPETFSPVNGKWGLRGATLVYLRLAKKSTVRHALAAAWRLNAPGRLTQQIDVQ